jgi:hypothetical protein
MLDPVAALSGDSYEIFLAGRRIVDQMLSMDWGGDAKAYVEVLPAYPPPGEPLDDG